MSKTHPVAHCLALLAALALVAGCGSAPGSGPEPPNPAKPKVLHIAAVDNPTSFDPAVAADVTTTEAIIDNVFSGLVAYDEAGNIQPEIAAAWRVSDNGKTYTFTLKDGVKFHSGRTVTADDFRWSLLRAANPAVHSSSASSYLNDITGFAGFFAAQAEANAPVSKLTREAKLLKGEVKAGKATQSQLDDLNRRLDEARKKAAADVAAAFKALERNPGIDTPDARTLVVHIAAPRPYFLAKLTYATACVVDRSVAPFDRPIPASADGIKLAVGTGPFTIGGFVDNSAITLKRWDGFYGAKAKVDSVDIQIVKEETPRYAKYKAGELDWTGPPPAEYQRILSDTAGEGKELHEYPYASIGYFVLNQKKYAPFQDRRVRQAFNYALDKENLIKVVYQGLAFPAYGILPPGIPGGNGDKIRKMTFDPVKARALLKEAGYDEQHPLPELTIIYRAPGESTQKAAEFYQQQFQANMPVKVKAQGMDLGQMLSESGKKNTLDAFAFGWSADYLDPQDFLSVLLACDAPNNRFGYCSKDVDSLLARADAAPPGAGRYALYGQAEQMIVDDAAWIPISFSKASVLVKGYVSGLRYNALGRMPLNTVDLAGH